MDYPAKRYIRMTTVDGAQVPAFAPLQEPDALTAYEPFLYPTMEEGLADLNSDIESRIAEIAADPESFDFEDEEDEDYDDGYYDDDSVLECTVNEDGSIESGGLIILTRERIFGVYGVQDVPARAPNI